MEIRNHTLKIASLLALSFFCWSDQAQAGALTKPANNVGIVGWWKLDDGGGGNAYDSSGGGNTGTLTDIDIVDDWVNGRVGGALDFNAGGYVDVGTAASLNPATAISVMAWIKPRSLGVPVATVVERLYGSSYILYLNGPNSDLIFNITGVDNESDPGILTTDVWQHIAVTYDSVAEEVRFYVNGELTGTTYSTGPIGQDSNTVLIGNDSTFSSPFDGFIDVRIYERAVSQADIRQIIRGDKVMKQATTPAASGELGEGQVGWYTMDGKDINWASGAVADMSGGGNTGFVIGMGTSSSPVDGRVGQALAFDGADDYVRTVLTSDADFTDSTFTITGWLRSGGGNAGKYFLAKDGTIGGFAAGIGGAGNIAVIVKNGSGLNVVSRPGVSALPSDVWVHFALVVTTDTAVAAGNDIQMYLNGVLNQGSLTTSANTYGTVSDAFVIGKRADGENFTGAMDDVRIYDHALSSAAINKLYNISRVTYGTTMTGGSMLEEGLSGSWSFDGKTVNWASGAVADTGTLGKHGYVFGFATGTAGVGGKVGQAFLFDGVNDFVDVAPSLGTVRTISFWLSTGVTTQEIINLSATENIEISSGTITATGVPGPTIYIDGTVSSTLPDSKWHHVIITSSAGVTANAFEIGRTSGSYYTGMIDDVRTWDRVLSAADRAKLYQVGR
jgi:hypothetical protein